MRRLLGILLLISCVMSSPMNLQALSPQAQERLKTSLKPDFETLANLQLNKEDREKMIVAVTSIGKITTQVVSDDTLTEVMASEVPKRLAVERKLKVWENAIPWFISGGAAIFLGGFIVGFNSRK
jgi:hypothetical protein